MFLCGSLYAFFTFNLVILSLYSFVWCVHFYCVYISVLPTGVIRRWRFVAEKVIASPAESNVSLPPGLSQRYRQGLRRLCLECVDILLAYSAAAAAVSLSAFMPRRRHGQTIFSHSSPHWTVRMASNVQSCLLPRIYQLTFFSVFVSALFLMSLQSLYLLGETFLVVWHAHQCRSFLWITQLLASSWIVSLAF